MPARSFVRLFECDVTFHSQTLLGTTTCKEWVFSH